jgi:hypothetical protein
MTDVVDPVTRFRIADEELGCRKLTVFGWPTEKPFQLTMARAELCVTLSVLPEVLIAALPAATDPPLGSTFAAHAPPVGVKLAQRIIAVELSSLYRVMDITASRICP